MEPPGRTHPKGREGRRRLGVAVRGEGRLPSRKASRLEMLRDSWKSPVRREGQATRDQVLETPPTGTQVASWPLGKPGSAWGWETGTWGRGSAQCDRGPH